ncbi:MAG: cupin domain-containing protein [Betaproteobacteria bacterium]|nr:cupin domain-containing protein [Betaproteobacteria bacterium]
MTKSAKIAPVLPESLASSLLLAMPPARLAAKREAALKKRILASIAAERHDTPMHTVRAGAGAWTAIAPDVQLQVLYDDGAAQSWLIRMNPGSQLPAHAHPGDEECLVLKGSCYLGDCLLREGDYQLARKGSRHGAIRSEEGCLLFIRSADRQPGASVMRA